MVGRLLAHLSADDPCVDEAGGKDLEVNRSAIVIMNSDGKPPKINATKRRIISELSRSGVWPGNC